MKLKTVLIGLVVILIIIWLFDKAIPGHRGCNGNCNGNCNGSCKGSNWSAPEAGNKKTCPNQ